MNGAKPRVAVLGLGIMGGGMAQRLLDEGFAVDVWNRSPAARNELAAHGAIAHDDAAGAAAAAGVVITMLPTGEVVEDVMLGGGALDAMGTQSTWAQMSTIGAAATERLAREAARRRPDVVFVDAPVAGTRTPARTGRLLILASGPEAARASTEDVFAALGQRTIWLGAAGVGSRLKLILNTWLAFEAEAAAEVGALAHALGVPHAVLVDAVQGGTTASGVALAKLAKAEAGDHSPDFPLEWALKDVDLAIAAAESVQLPIAAAIAQRWHSLVREDVGRLDISAARIGLDQELAARESRAADANRPRDIVDASAAARSS